MSRLAVCGQDFNVNVCKSRRKSATLEWAGERGWFAVWRQFLPRAASRCFTAWQKDTSLATQCPPKILLDQIPLSNSIMLTTKLFAHSAWRVNIQWQVYFFMVALPTQSPSLISQDKLLLVLFYCSDGFGSFCDEMKINVTTFLFCFQIHFTQDTVHWESGLISTTTNIRITRKAFKIWV